MRKYPMSDWEIGSKKLVASTTNARELRPLYNELLDEYQMHLIEAEKAKNAFLELLEWSGYSKTIDEQFDHIEKQLHYAPYQD